jgi:hypothetical protein
MGADPTRSSYPRIQKLHTYSYRFSDRLLESISTMFLCASVIKLQSKVCTFHIYVSFLALTRSITVLNLNELGRDSLTRYSLPRLGDALARSIRLDTSLARRGEIAK